MAEMYIATIPQCPTHGKMKWIHPQDERGVYLSSYWECLGWDGEGCPTRVTEEQMDWQPVAAEEITWKTNGPR